MATNKNIQLSGHRGRTLLRLAILGLAIAIGAYAYGASSASSGSPAKASRVARTAAKDTRPYSYGWPVKPFDQQHPIRGNFGDPRSTFLGPPTVRSLLTSPGTFSYHQGIDISVPDRTPVYPVRSGIVRRVTREWVGVESDNGVSFQYWHITPQVQVGQTVTEDETVLGRTLRGFEHVHLTQLQNGRAVNPLAPGNLGPYADTTAPSVGEISFRASDTGPELMPEYLHGRVEIVAAAWDMPSMSVPGVWNGLPVAPARLTFHIERLPTHRIAYPETTAMDLTHSLPASPNMWQTYARGTHQNFVPMGAHRYWFQPAVYLFKLSASFDTDRLADGAYLLVATAYDSSGNHRSATQVFSVHNRVGWLNG